MSGVYPITGSRPGDDSAPNYQWWLSDKPGDDMVRTARTLLQKQSGQREKDLFHARLHGGADVAALTPAGYARSAGANGVSLGEGSVVGLNVIENICSAAQAEICQDKPKATFTTDGGDWEAKEKAEQLTKFSEAQLYESRMYELGPRIFLDAVIFGTGIAKVYEDPTTGRIKAERVFPWELLVDQADGLYGEPRCIYQTKYVDRAVLKACYPEHAKELANVATTYVGDGMPRDTTADLVLVIEGWRLPSGKDTKDGRHVIACGDVTLLDEEYEQRSFPFIFLRWLDRPFGFWGKGIPEQVAGIQKEINWLLLKIQRAFKKLGITRVYVERGSKVNVAHLRNQDGDIIEYTGKPPVTEPAGTIHPEVFNHLWRLEQKAYEVTGIAQMTAQGSSPPPGVDSGRAIRTLLANHSKRITVVANAYAAFFVEVSRKMIELAHALAKREEENDEEGEAKRKGYKVRFATEAGFEDIDFSDIDLDLDNINMRPYPTSALPSNPGEKMQQIQEWFNSGVIDGDQMLMLMDFPDTKQFADMNPMVAARRSIMRRLTLIVKHGKPWTPDGTIPLDLAKQLAVPFLLQAEMDGCPEARLDMLRQTIDELVQLEGAQQGQPQAPGGAPALPQPGPAPVPGQVDPMAAMANPMAPAA